MLITVLLFFLSLITVVSSAIFFSKTFAKVLNAYKLTNKLESWILLSFILSLPIASFLTYNNLFSLPPFGGVTLLLYVIFLISFALPFFLLLSSKEVHNQDNKLLSFLWAVSLLWLISASDGLIDRFEGLSLILVFLLYFVYVLLSSKTKEFFYIKYDRKDAILMPTGLVVLITAPIFSAFFAIALPFYFSKFIMVLISVFFGAPMLYFIYSRTAQEREIVNNILGNAITSLSLFGGLNALIYPLPVYFRNFNSFFLLLALNVLVLTFVVIAKFSRKIRKSFAFLMLLLYFVTIAIYLEVF